jgi:bis(5'-nucleosyl)-tetraphosphatase (symmetrical)
MRYAIGDVQGCASELEDLLNVIAFNPSRDEVIFTGDLVNRGPESARTLRLVRALGVSARTVLGNHDFFLLRYALGYGQAHAGDTLDDVTTAPDAEELLTWLRQQPLAIVEGDLIVVHAGVLPQWTRGDVYAYAQEIERDLRGPDWQSYLRDLFANTHMPWTEKLIGMERSRTIVNALCRLRYCDPFGVMEYAEKRGLAHTPEGKRAWFLHPHRRTQAQTVIAGHWSSLGLYLAPNVKMLDSGCSWGGALTALRLDDGAVFAVPSRQPLSQFDGE